MRRILVSGRERSGTKAFSKLIAKNLDYFICENGEIDGVLESNLTGVFQRRIAAGLLDPEKDSEMMLNESFQKFLPLSFKLRSTLFNESSDLTSFLISLMDEAARKENKKGWVLKIASRDIEFFKGVNFIQKLLIQRTPIESAISLKKLEKSGNWLRFSRILIGGHVNRKLELIDCKYDLVVDYHTIFVESDLSLLNVEFPNVVIRSLDRKEFNNSSFETEKDSKVPVNYRLMDGFSKIIVKLIPSPILGFVVRIIRRKVVPEIIFGSY